MSTDPMELLSAFVDGEDVEADALAEALRAPGSREALLDYACIRAEIDRDESTPSTEVYDTIERLTGTLDPRAWWRRAIPVPAPALAAGVLLVVALGAFASLQTSAPGSEIPESPPPPDRTLPFETGVDWTEGA